MQAAVANCNGKESERLQLDWQEYELRRECIGPLPCLMHSGVDMAVNEHIGQESRQSYYYYYHLTSIGNSLGPMLAPQGVSAWR